MKLFYVRMHDNNPPMIIFGETRAKVGRLIKKMLGPGMVDEVIPISRQDAEAEFGDMYMKQARWNMLRSEDMSNTSVLSGDNPFLFEKMNLKKADMGDVVKDFQQSDAPQFAGKSKAKRRQMAIAAKLQAEEENFANKAAKERLNAVIKRHEDAASHHKAEFNKTGDPKHQNRHMFHRQAAEIATKKHASIGEGVEYTLSHVAEGVDQKVLKTFKTMLKDGEEDSVRLLLQGMPKHTKNIYMSRLGIKESDKIDGRTKAFRETISRLNMAKVKPSINEDDLEERTPVKPFIKDRKLPNLKVPNPNYKKHAPARDKKNERSMDVYREDLKNNN